MKLDVFTGDVRTALNKCVILYLLGCPERTGGAGKVRQYWETLGHHLHRAFDVQWASNNGEDYKHVPGSKSRLAMVLKVIRGEVARARRKDRDVDVRRYLE